MNNVFIGYDEREHDAYKATVRSLYRYSGVGVRHTPIVAQRLQQQGLLYRPVYTKDNLRWDIHSNAPCSTDFSISRFLTPLLAQTGVALFVDCDVVFLTDVERIMQHYDPKYAVMVVKHDMGDVSGQKMDNQPQVAYPRKNWSSVILWNCDHPANRRLTLHDVNYRTGKELHGFYWLHDSEIGALPAEWNWLVNVQPKPERPCIAHFTLGGPFTPNWPGAPYDDLWMSFADQEK